MKHITAMKLAMDALLHQPWKNWRTDKAIAALQAAMAEPQSKAVFFRHEDICGDEVGPPTVLWTSPTHLGEPLTDEEIDKIWHSSFEFIDDKGKWLKLFARAIEAAIRSKT